MIIRSASKSDYDQLIVLLNEFVGEDRYSNKNNDSFLKVLNSSTSHLLVAEVENQLIGFITFSIRTVLRYPKPIAELDELVVSSMHRKKGIGQLLTEAALIKAKELGCYRIYIESHYKHIPAHKLYERVGFTNYGYHFMKNL